MDYSIHYFDGKTSKKHKANLKVQDEFWTIHIESNDSLIYWQKENIIPSDVSSGGIISFNYGEFPFQKIESTDSHFINFINQNKSYSKIQHRWDNKFQNNKIKSVLIFIITIVSLFLFTYKIIIPKTTDAIVSNLAPEYIEDFGMVVFNSLSLGLNIDNEASIKLQEFTDYLNLKSEYPLKMYVSKEKQVNAFAISGGKIVVYSSLLSKLENESQLAALIAHEITHIEKRHGLKNVARNLSGLILLSVVFGDVNGISAVFVENAHMFEQLNYSRELEKEADIHGIELLKQSNVSLEGMPQLFKILKKETPFEESSYFSSHPELQDRIDYTQKIFKEHPERINDTILTQKWMELKATIN
jgi:predicted Zn-dependent protease